MSLCFLRIRPYSRDKSRMISQNDLSKNRAFWLELILSPSLYYFNITCNTGANARISNKIFFDLFLNTLEMGKRKRESTETKTKKRYKHDGLLKIYLKKKFKIFRYFKINSKKTKKETRARVFNSLVWWVDERIEWANWARWRWDYVRSGRDWHFVPKFISYFLF